MKKRLIVMLIASLFILFLSGCQPDHNEKDVTGEYTLPVNELGKGLGDIQNTEITYIYTPNPSIDLKYHPDFQEVIFKVQERMLEKHQIKVNMEFIPYHNYYETISKRIQSNDRIDVFSPHQSKYPNMNPSRFDRQYYLQQWINTFEIADLTDYINVYYPQMNEYILDSDIREAVVYNDRIYGVPGISAYMQGNLQVLAIYKEYYESIDKPQIEIIDDLYRLIRSVEDSKYLNKGRIICSFEDFLSWHCGNNGYVYLRHLLAYQGKTILALENEPVLLEAFNLYQDLSDLVLEQDIPFYWTGNWDVPGTKDIDPNDPMSFPPVLIQLSTYDEFYLKSISNTDRFNEEYEILFLNNPCTVTYDHNSLNYLINGASPFVESALFFLNCLDTDPEIYDLLRYGIKDKHYKLNDQGAVSFEENLFIGWDYTDRLISRNLERPMVFELNASKTVWEDYVKKSNYIIDGIHYKKLLRIDFDQNEVDSDLSRLISNRSAFYLFKEFEDPNTNRNTLTSVIKTGIEFGDFIGYYNDNEARTIIKALQEIIDQLLMK